MEGGMAGIFEVAQQVAEPLALVAFIGALVAYAYRYWLAERRRLIETAPESERAELLNTTMRGFSAISLDNLTRQQRLELATQLIEERKFRLQLFSGSALALALVLVAMLWLVGSTSPDAASLTVRMHGPEGSGDLITTGRVLLDVGAERKAQAIGADGQVTFYNIPQALIQQHGITLVPQVPGYSPVSPTRLSELPPGGTYALAMAPDTAHVSGSVLSAAGRVPLAGVILDFGSGIAVDTTDEHGHYRVMLPRPPGTRMSLRAFREGVTGFDDYVVIPETQALDILFRGEG